jgi:choline dehydrogenase-like flavoprotein
MVPGLARERRIVVVGSGPPGAAAALFASRAGADVVVLEAGPERSALGLTARVKGFTVAKYRRPLRQNGAYTATADPQALLYEEIAPGGLSNHWSCAVPRFADEDFADARRAGEEWEWPVGYADLAPWYDRVEPLLHVAAGTRGHAQLPAANARDARDLGADWDPIAAVATRNGRTVAPMPYAYGAETGVTFSGTVFNAFTRLLKPALRAGTVSMRFDAQVERLEWSPGDKRVTAVIVRDGRTGSESRVPCEAVVVAAGAIRTPEILLASTSADFPEGLGNTHGVLGRYLHDHPLAKLVVDLSSPVSVHPPSYLTRPVLDGAPPLYAAACMQWSGMDVLLQSLRQRRLLRLPWLGFSVFGTMAPSRDDWVAIDPSRPRAKGFRPLDLHVRHPPQSLVALEKARDDLVSILAGAGLAPRVRIWHVEPVGESKHYGGTCRMHASPRYGMIDARGRMHAVRNVAVADSSAFTTGPEKNPVLTAMALGARAASHLAEDVVAGGG